MMKPRSCVIFTFAISILVHIETPSFIHRTKSENRTVRNRCH